MRLKRGSDGREMSFWALPGLLFRSAVSLGTVARPHDDSRPLRLHLLSTARRDRGETK